MAKTLRAADIGYVWPEWLPDGRAFTRDSFGEITFHEKPPRECMRVADYTGDWLSEAECEVAGIPVPDFGDRPWQECILVKGDEPPELPPCPPGEGWIEWSGGECPVADDALVEVQLLKPGGGSQKPSEAGDWAWGWEGKPHPAQYHIIRYRIVEPPKPKMRPYNAKELESLVCTPVRRRCGRDVVAIERAWRGDIMVYGMWCGADRFLSDYEHLDGRPCGVEVTDG